MKGFPLTWTLALWIALFAPGCGEIAPPGEEVAPASDTADDLLSAHMAAEAMLTVPFASLLTGDQVVVEQGFMPRDLDGMVFKYVGAAGVDQARIVQVGVAAPQESDAP